MLNQIIFKQIRSHALSEYPKEACGLIIYNNQKSCVIPCRNISTEPINHFILSPIDYLKACLKGKIEWLYHSHSQPDHNENLTHLDILNSNIHHRPMILYNMVYNKFSFNQDNSLLKYVGVPFIYNNNDCLSLVEKFYKNEFKITLPSYTRNQNTLENNPSLFLDKMDKYGFRSINNNIQYGDIIMTGYDKYPSHLMIYIGDNQVLHHRYNYYSNIEYLSELYKKYIINVVRHHKLWN